jgi:hypothetical protein
VFYSLLNNQQNLGAGRGPTSGPVYRLECWPITQSASILVRCLVLGCLVRLF